MNKKSGTSKNAADKLVKGIRRKTRKQYSAEEKIRIVVAGLRGEESIAALCRREDFGGANVTNTDFSGGITYRALSASGGAFGGFDRAWKSEITCGANSIGECR